MNRASIVCSLYRRCKLKERLSTAFPLEDTIYYLDAIVGVLLVR
jgi:hypothetical protein